MRIWHLTMHKFSFTYLNLRITRPNIVIFLNSILKLIITLISDQSSLIPYFSRQLLSCSPSKEQCNPAQRDKYKRSITTRSARLNNSNWEVGASGKIATIQCFFPPGTFDSLLFLPFMSPHTSEIFTSISWKRVKGKKRRHGRQGARCDSRAKRYEIEPPRLQLALFESGLISWTLLNKVNGKNDVPRSWVGYFWG